MSGLKHENYNNDPECFQTGLASLHIRPLTQANTSLMADYIMSAVLGYARGWCQIKANTREPNSRALHREQNKEIA